MSSDISMRRAKADEANVIRDLVRAAYAKWVPVIGREPRPMQADYDAALKLHRFDVMEQAGRIVALIETEPRVDHLWIENIAVTPEAQGQGLGKRLLAHAEDLALAQGFGEIRLLTNGRMGSNRQLYADSGYIADREEPFDDGTVVYLSKRL